MEKFFEHPDIIAGASIGVTIALILGFLFIFWLFNIICMMMGAKAAGIQNRSFGKAFLASILISWLGGTLIGFLTLLNPIAGLVGLLLVPALFIKLVYSCGLGEAIVAYIVNVIASIALMIVLILTLIFGFGLSVDKLKSESSTNSVLIENNCDV
jgi:hypothetical protein